MARLITIIVADTPVAVMNLETSLPVGMPAEIREEHAKTEALIAQRASKMPPEVRLSMDELQIQEQARTWLCEDLHNTGLWDGDPESITVRLATDAEAATWRATLVAAIAAGDQDKGDDDFLVFLVDR